MRTNETRQEMSSTDRYAALRDRMVREQLRRRKIRDERLLTVMSRVPRHRFVPDDGAAGSYGDHPLPIGHDQTISQPYIVAYMTELAALEGNERVLEIGTGSGYQAAVLAELAREVYSIEIIPPLAKRAARTLSELGYRNIHLREGDGYAGWPEAAPFDAIIVTAAPDHVPQPLIDQLAPGGRMVIPVGDAYQEILVLRRTPSGIERKRLLPVRFVPMTGKARG